MFFHAAFDIFFFSTEIDVLIIVRFSWIHLDDIVNLIYEALSNSSYKGNLSGLTWKDFLLSSLEA